MATSPFGFSGTGKQAAPPRPRPQYNPTPGPNASMDDVRTHRLKRLVPQNTWEFFGGQSQHPDAAQANQLRSLVDRPSPMNLPTGPYQGAQDSGFMEQQGQLPGPRPQPQQTYPTSLQGPAPPPSPGLFQKPTAPGQTSTMINPSPETQMGLQMAAAGGLKAQPGPQGTGTYPVTQVNSQNDALRQQVEGYEKRAANRPDAGQNVTLAALGPPKPLDPSRSLAPADMQPRNVSPVNYQDQARTQFGAHLPGYEPIPGMSRPAASSASVGPATQEKVDRIFGAGKKIVVDGQIRNAPGTERNGPGRLSDGSIAWSPVTTRHNKNLSSKEQAAVDAAQAAAAERFGTDAAPGPNQLAQIARDKRAATPQGQAVAANAANRGQQRRERIAMRKNPAVARNIFFADQERQMQGLRNQGAIGVAEQNARGDISRIGGQEALQRERLNIARQQAGLPLAQSPGTPPPTQSPLDENTPTSAEYSRMAPDEKAAVKANLPKATQERLDAQQNRGGFIDRLLGVSPINQPNQAPVVPSAEGLPWFDARSLNQYNPLWRVAGAMVNTPEFNNPNHQAASEIANEDLQDRPGDSPGMKRLKAQLRAKRGL